MWGPEVGGQGRILEMFSVQKGAFIVAQGQDLWAERAARVQYEAGGYMLSAQRRGDMQGRVDYKCLLQIFF